MTTSNKIKVCIAGATGWAGSALSKAIVASSEFELVAGVSRKHAKKDLNDVLGFDTPKVPVFTTVGEALEISCDVMVEYTNPNIAKSNILTALSQGVNVVVGTSGLSDADYLEINTAAQKAGKGVLAVGNFAITVVLLNKFAEMAAKFIPNWEIIDYATQDKPDSPSGSALELSYRLQQIRESRLTIPIDDTIGIKETRGARINGTQVHSVRLPGYVISLEAIFGLEGEKLTIRHDGGNSPVPYIDGALLAIRKVSSFKGLKRGLDSVMDL